MTTQTRMDGGFGFPLGLAAAVAVTVITISEGATSHHGYSLGALLVLVAVVASTTTTRAALGIAAVAWGLHAGFVLGRFGQLVFTPESIRAAMLLVAVGVIAAAVGAGMRSASRHERREGTTGHGPHAVAPDPSDDLPRHVIHQPLTIHDRIHQ